MPKSKYDEIEDTPQRSQNAEFDLVILAAHALKLDSPIINYRIVGSRIELWTCHGGPFIYDPAASAKSGGKVRKQTTRSNRVATKPAAKK